MMNLQKVQGTGIFVTGFDISVLRTFRFRKGTSLLQIFWVLCTCGTTLEYLFAILTQIPHSNVSIPKSLESFRDWKRQSAISKARG